jgi:hypothetical protein
MFTVAASIAMSDADYASWLGARVGRGGGELHDRIMVGFRVGRVELDELWAFRVYESLWTLS